MQIHNLKPTTPSKETKRIGRGGKRGKTSGRGGKGQTARTGNSGRPEMRDIIKRIPKLRGHGKNRSRTVNAERVLPAVVNLNAIESAFEANAQVTPVTLLAHGLIGKNGGRVPQVKILGTGEITKKFTVSGCTFSEGAKAKIEKAGGAIVG
jgi:large subunit ribosomal protein L15